MSTLSILNNYFYPKIFQIESIINHPFKILISYLKKIHSPYDCARDGIDLCNLYFSSLDIYQTMLNKEKKPLSNHELNKRKVIKEQKNIYLQIAMMDPKIYDNDEFFEDQIEGLLDDYNADFRGHCFLMFTNEKEDESFKKRYKVLLDMIKNINDLIEKD